MGKTFFGKNVKAKIQVNGTSLTVGMVQSITLTQTKDVAEARGGGSAKRQAVALNELGYDIDVELQEYNIETISEIMGLDLETTGGQSKDDPANPVTVLIGGSYVAQDGTQVNFETLEYVPDEVSWGGDHDQFIPLEMTGTATDIDMSTGELTL